MAKGQLPSAVSCARACLCLIYPIISIEPPIIYSCEGSHQILKLVTAALGSEEEDDAEAEEEDAEEGAEEVDTKEA